MRTKSRRILTLAIGAAIALPAGAFAQSGGAQPAPPVGAPPNAQVPQPDQGGVNWEGVGVGAGTVAGNVLYIPAKLVYGILGGIAGGAGYALTGGNKQVADTIWRSSLGGDYVLTPDMVSGKQPVHFSGPTETAPTQTSSVDSTAPTTASYGTSSNPAVATTAPYSSYSSLSGSSVPPSAIGQSGTHPIDSGAGPVGGSGTLSSSDLESGKSSARPNASAPVAPHRMQLPDTSIE